MRQRAPESIQQPQDQGISFPHAGQGRCQTGRSAFALKKDKAANFHQHIQIQVATVTAPALAYDFLRFLRRSKLGSRRFGLNAFNQPLLELALRLCSFLLAFGLMQALMENYGLLALLTRPLG